MKTEMQLVWAFVSCGLLIHCTSGENQTTAGPSTTGNTKTTSQLATEPTGGPTTGNAFKSTSTVYSATGSTGNLTGIATTPVNFGTTGTPTPVPYGTAIHLQTTTFLPVTPGSAGAPTAGYTDSPTTDPGKPTTGSPGKPTTGLTGDAINGSTVEPTIGPTSHPVHSTTSDSTSGPNGGAAGMSKEQSTTEPENSGATTWNKTTPSNDVSTPAVLVTTTNTITVKPAFNFFMSKGAKDHEKPNLSKLCEWLMENMLEATCNLTVREHGSKTEFDSIMLIGKGNPTLARRYHEKLVGTNIEISEDKTTLIAILAFCGALLAIIVGLAIYASRQRKPYCENQQHLTEELQTVENGYHDNPTLEVMEVQPEMQEKKMALNGEFNDSWIVPIDNLLKDDIPDEEDTHL
ncbi:podocalyxin [Hypomesus transpacificus]|uniref:podocalyxin n=1 Tax=Hypomesus transpacificus TaxID=137520 RepID=UPI001F078298|nr:podocalyxin [Hypomesus transpacificus]